MKDGDSIEIKRCENGWIIMPAPHQSGYQIRPMRVAETQSSLLEYVRELTLPKDET